MKNIQGILAILLISLIACGWKGKICSGVKKGLKIMGAINTVVSFGRLIALRRLNQVDEFETKPEEVALPNVHQFELKEKVNLILQHIADLVSNVQEMGSNFAEEYKIKEKAQQAVNDFYAILAKIALKEKNLRNEGAQELDEKALTSLESLTKAVEMVFAQAAEEGECEL